MTDGSHRSPKTWREGASTISPPPRKYSTVVPVSMIEVNASRRRSTSSLSRARRCGAGYEGAEGGVPALEEVVALGFRDLVGRARVVHLRRYPDAPVVAERLAHEGELRLEVGARRDARRVDLGEARARHQRAPTVCPPDRGHVAALGVRRQIEGVAVPARRQHDGVRRV